MTQAEPVRYRCVIILSAKSSGSSMLQRLLATDPRIRPVAHTRHSENETLYWTKAASVLGMPQVAMLDSEVPIPAQRARRELVEFLSANVGASDVALDRAGIFDGWRRLCIRYQPVLLEKSPHHLLQWSALELIAECMSRCPEVEFTIVGLVRNPMDTIYSAWQRWQIYPEHKQREWVAEYRNLLASRQLFGQRLVVLRYEDLVNGAEDLGTLVSTLGLGPLALGRAALHAQSVQRWRADARFGFVLDAEAAELAARFGYSAASLQNPTRAVGWIAYRNVTRWRRRAARLTRDCARHLARGRDA